MRALGRILALLLALPLLAGGLTALAVHLLPEAKRDPVRQGLIGAVPAEWSDAGELAVDVVTRTLEPTWAHGPVLGVALLLAGYAFWPRGGKQVRRKTSRKVKSRAKGASKRPRKAPAKRAASPAAAAEQDEDEESAEAGAEESGAPSKKELKRLLKLAASIEQEVGAEAAADFLLGEGALEEASDLFQREGLNERLAEVRHDQNRFEEAAQLYQEAGKWETAGSIWAQIERFEEAARCYVKAEKRSVAGEMFERAGNHREAGRCYRDIGFHRHAAQAFLKGGCELEAAQSLVAAFDEEGGGAAGTEQSQRELRSMAKKAGELFYKLERFEEAESILVRAGSFAAAAKVAFHTGAYDRAAELFLRVGRGDLAARALEKLEDPRAAAKALGEYLRDKGQDEEAVVQLERAEEYQEAGDLYRKLSRFAEAGSCYVRTGDQAAAAEMFRAAGELGKAGEAYEQAGQFDQAAECFGSTGDPLRRAQLLEKAGQLHDAGTAFVEQDHPDEAIRVLQRVPQDDEAFPQVCAVLGKLFRDKGMHSLSVKKFEEATQGDALTRENVDAYYELGRSYQARGDLDRAIELFERILGFDYHFEDVAERLEGAKAEREANPPAPETDPEQRPAASGRYQVMHEIGRGGMGVVFRARDSVLEREVAYKVLPEQLRENPNALRNFLREAKAAAQLNHPNIVTVYDAGESEHGFYLAMELVEGTTLKEIVQRRGPVSAGGVVYILRQMAEALAFAHSKKVVHRDIKTANTMWTPERQVKIMDFGLAKLMEEVRNATTVVSGTPFYMSPEQTLGKNVDHRTDIYSLGVTLYELATGDLPFRRGNVPYHHVHTPPPDPMEANAKIPPGLAAIILRCLQKSPDERYASARDLIAEVDGLSGAGQS